MMQIFSTIFAQDGIVNPILQGTALEGMSGPGFVANFVRVAVTGVLIVGVIVFFFMFVLGAISWMTSGGDKGAYEAARQRVVNAVIGLFIMLTLWGIITLLEAMFGIDILTIDLSSLVIGGGGGGGGILTHPCSNGVQTWDCPVTTGCGSSPGQCISI